MKDAYEYVLDQEKTLAVLADAMDSGVETVSLFEKGCYYSAHNNMSKYLESQSLTKVALGEIAQVFLQQFLHHILEPD